MYSSRVESDRCLNKNVSNVVLAGFMNRLTTSLKYLTRVSEQPHFAIAVTFSLQGMWRDLLKSMTSCLERLGLERLERINIH